MFFNRENMMTMLDGEPHGGRVGPPWRVPASRGCRMDEERIMTSELFSISDMERTMAYLMIARDMERYTAEFYYRMGLKLDIERFQEIALAMAMDETDHLYMIGRMAGSIEGRGEKLDIDMNYYEELKHRSLVFPDITEFEDMNILTFFDTALAIERKTIEFYSTPLKLGISFQPMKDILEKIVSMESDHLCKMESIKSDVLERDGQDGPDRCR